MGTPLGGEETLCVSVSISVSVYACVYITYICMHVYSCVEI